MTVTMKEKGEEREREREREREEGRERREDYLSFLSEIKLLIIPVLFC